MISPPFDFRKPPPSDLERQVSGWMAMACRRTASLWPKALNYPAEMTPGIVESIPAADAIREFPEDSLGVMLKASSPAAGITMLAIRRPLLLALLAGFLGDTPSEIPADRDPTDLEAALIGHFVRELIIEPLEKGWPAVQPIHLSAGEFGSPSTAWPGQGTEMVLRATLGVKGPFGEEQMYLILSKSGRWQDLAQSNHSPASQEPASKIEIEAIVNEMNVDLEILLGTAELKMSEVSQLKAGDLLVLRQKVADPLDGLIAGSKKFRVWPGAVGTRAAIQIHTTTEG